MSGGFRDSFTKDDAKEDVLGYDDTAFHYFVVTVLTCIAFPWTINFTYSAICCGLTQIEGAFPTKHATSGFMVRHPKTSAMVEKMDASKRAANRCTNISLILWGLRIAVLVSMWICVFFDVAWLSNAKDIKKFDPFEILDVTTDATIPQIKRSYRKLSLTYHPDKNTNDPLAQSRFIEITKAYQALTDDVAKSNWEKYGNPDGPQTTKVGIGLPRFLLEKENHLMILCVFFVLLLFVFPMTFICYYQQAKNYAANGVMLETLQFLGFHIKKGTRLQHCPELLAASAESRAIKVLPTDNSAFNSMCTRVQEHSRRTFSLPVIVKNHYLVLAHMQRFHHLMSDELRTAADELLSKSMCITQAMIEIACMREWFSTARTLIEFRRCLVQALDVKSHQLLQVPHLCDKQVARFTAATPPVSTLAEFLALGAEKRSSLLDLDPQQRADVEAFCSHIGEIHLTAQVEVDDEDEFVVGDVATVTAQMVRKNLAMGQAMGAVHAPFFPDAKYEEWWFFLVDDTGSEARIVHFERVCDVTRCAQQQLRFQVTKPGKNDLILHLLCDSYYGLDQSIELSFNAYAEDEFTRPFKVHKDDEELDLHQTLYQQVLGERSCADDEGEEEEEEEEEGEEEKVTTGGTDRCSEA